jgi:hypothetical protein
MTYTETEYQVFRSVVEGGWFKYYIKEYWDSLGSKKERWNFAKEFEGVCAILLDEPYFHYALRWILKDSYTNSLEEEFYIFAEMDQNYGARLEEIFIPEEISRLKRLYKPIVTEIYQNLARQAGKSL